MNFKILYKHSFKLINITIDIIITAIAIIIENATLYKTSFKIILSIFLFLTTSNANIIANTLNSNPINIVNAVTKIPIRVSSIFICIVNIILANIGSINNMPTSLILTLLSPNTLRVLK